MKRYILLFCVLFAVIANAQTGIGTTTPHTSAKLEVAATDKGFLPPRISLTGMLDVTTIPSPATGLVIYNTVAAGVTPNNVVPGYYYWDGTKWNGLVDQGALNAFSGFIPNYAQSNASSVTRSSVGDIVVSQSITTSGRPIQIIATGDANPLSSGAWVQLQLFRDGTAIGKKIQAESSSSNENVPYCLNFIDNPTAGTYTYSVRITANGGGSYQFGEADGNQLTLLELGAWSAGTMPLSRGGTGSTNFSNGSVLFSDGSRIAEKNTQFFWDNTNNRLGIGTTSPSVPLDVNGAVNANTLSLSNVATGTSSLILRNGDAATTFGDNPQIRMGWSGSPTGTNQYAQIIHTRHNAGPTNNAIDFYLSDGTASNTITNGSTRAMTITSPGNVEITGRLNVGDPTGNVATKIAARVDAGVEISLDNLKARVTTSGSRGLEIGAVSGTISLHVQGSYTNVTGVAGTRTPAPTTYTTTFSGSLFGWSFGAESDTAVYHFADVSNSRFYRVTLMIGSSYFNNFIAIERLL